MSLFLSILLFLLCFDIGVVSSQLILLDDATERTSRGDEGHLDHTPYTRALVALSFGLVGL